MAFPLSQISRFHSIVWLRSQPGGTHKSPGIVVDQGINGGPGLLAEAWAFMLQPHVFSKSSSWREKAATDIGRFYDYFRACGGSTETQTRADNLVNGFLLAALYGTIREDGSDPTALFWRAMSNARFRVLQRNIRLFLEFLEDFLPGNTLSATRFAKRSISAFALEQRKKNSLLYHLTARGGSSGHGTRPGLPQLPAPPTQTVKKFPRDRLVDLVVEGCRLSRRRPSSSSRLDREHNINMVMALSLMIGGGIRRSELFHIWVDDVQPAAGKGGMVYLYHPADGVAGPGVRRQDVLLSEYGRVPRNHLPRGDKEHAGWKDLLLDDPRHKRAEIYWCHPSWRDLFMRAFQEYRDEVRPDRAGHPYLFVSLGQGTVGSPWTVNSFNQSFAAALRRIGLEPDHRSGLNPHGLRHAYGQYLRDIGLHPQFIQRAMHHVSPVSQQVYTAPEAHEVHAALEACRTGVAAQDWAPDAAGTAIDIALIARKDPAGVLAAWGLKGSS